MNNNFKPKYKYKIIKKIVNANFTWGDLNTKYSNLEQLVGLTWCPFHENHNTPSAKFYFDEENGLWLIHCFSEHKSFSSFDYLNLIMCKQKQLYKSPLEFILQKLGKSEFSRQYKLYEKDEFEYTENQFKKKVEWINNVYEETGNTVDYIEELYTA